MADIDDYVDDASIADGAELWRRIPSWHFIYDENLGRMRPSTAAFEDHPNRSPMSVLLADVIFRGGRDAASLVEAFPGFAIAAITAGVARSCQQGIAREPLEEEPAHAVIFGRKTDGVKKRLAKAARWVLPPESR
jgi:hypothetical protein